MTPKELASFSQAIYAAASKWDFDFTIADVRVGCVVVDNGVLVVPRGTLVQSRGDLERDAFCLPWNAGELGHLHAGFWLGEQLFEERVDAFVGDRPCFVTGHSLGAAMGLLYAARRAIRKLSIVYATTFGCPRLAWNPLRVTDTPLAKATATLNGADYIHATDPVPDFPLDYTHARTCTKLASKWSWSDPFAYHAITSYIDSVP